SAKTQKEYRRTYRLLEEFLGAVPIASITQLNLIEFMEWLLPKLQPRQGRKNAAAATQGKHASALKSLFRWAAQKKHVRENVAATIQPTKSSKKEARKFARRPFDPDE